MADHKPSPEPVLRLRGISKKFPGVQALNDVSFELRVGEVHALMGENGAGKSTLMNVLGGLVRKDSGTIELNGEEVENSSPYEARARGISFIHQELEVVSNITVTENIFLGKEPRKPPFGLIDWKTAEKRAGDFLREIGVEVDARAMVGDLSIAEQQLIEIAKALFINAQIIVMDEPTSSLGGDDIRKLFDIIRDLRARGYSVIYVSHVMDEIFELSDRITVLRSGEYVGTRDTAEATRDELFEMIVGREVGERYVRESTAPGRRLLEVKGLSTAGIVDDVSLYARAGELVGIAGLIGSGRTELLEAMFGMVPKTAGEIEVDGQTVTAQSPDEAIQRGLYYVSEDRRRKGLFSTLNLLSNVGISTASQHRRWWGIKESEERDRIAELSDQLSIKTPSLDQLVAHLSGGNQQKAMLARGLKSEPKIVMLNEPTRGIDVGAKVEIYRLLNRLKREGLAVVMVSSELPEVLSISDRIVVMSDGRISSEFSHETADKQAVLKAMFAYVGHKKGDHEEQHHTVG